MLRSKYSHYAHRVMRAPDRKNHRLPDAKHPKAILTPVRSPTEIENLFPRIQNSKQSTQPRTSSRIKVRLSDFVKKNYSSSPIGMPSFRENSLCIICAFSSFLTRISSKGGRFGRFQSKSILYPITWPDLLVFFRMQSPFIS